MIFYIVNHISISLLQNTQNMGTHLPRIRTNQQMSQSSPIASYGIGNQPTPRIASTPPGTVHSSPSERTDSFLKDFNLSAPYAL
jgi:hypothetical protein